jgi:DNA-binding CsgD family transcriptional regulator
VIDAVTPAPDPAHRPPRVIGRAAELAAVRALVDDRAAAPRALLLSGEPGVGKSTVLEAGCAMARDAGLPVLATLCAETEADMAYVTLEDLVGDLLDGTPDLPDPQRAAVEAAVLRRVDGSPTDPRTVAVGVLTLLRARLDTGPVLVAVDDEQWLDPETRRCLTFAARRLGDRPLRLLVASRTASPWWSPPSGRGDPSALAGPRAAIRSTTLVGLEPEGVAELLAERIDDAAGARAASIAAQCGGNPFWALELGRRPDADRPLRAVIGDRLAALEPGALRAARLVAALGRVRPIDVVDRGGASGAQVDAAVTVGLVALRGGQLVPSHPLVGTALLAGLAPFARRALHRTAAAVAVPAEERAEQLLRAAELGTTPEEHADLLAALDTAATTALRRGALRLAVRLADEAVAHDGGEDRAAPHRRLRAAELHVRGATFARARRLLATFALDALDADTFDVVVPLLADATYRAEGEAAARAVVASLDALPVPTDPATAARRRTVRDALRSEPLYGDADRLEVAVRAAATAGASHPAVTRRALGNLAFARLDAGEPLDDDLWRRHAELAPADAALEIGGMDIVAGRALEVADRLDEACAHLAACAARARAAGDDVGVLRAGLSLAYGHYVAGRPTASARALDELPDLTPREDAEPAELMGVRGMLRLAAADPVGVEEVIERGLAERPVLPRRRLLVRYLRGLLARQQGDPVEAAGQLWHVLTTAAGRGLHEPGRRLLVDSDLGDALIEAGEVDRAAAITDWVERVAHGRPTPAGVAARLRAGLALASGDLDAALAHARAAVAHHARGPRPPEHGRSLLVLARVARERGDAAAGAHAEAARSVLADAGMVWWRDRAAEVVRETADRDPLTPAERAVADLVAGGASNRAAAATLHLSVRTVEYHLGAVFRKLGVRSRGELPPPATARGNGR